jgi:hypothetical protein
MQLRFLSCVVPWVAGMTISGPNPGLVLSLKNRSGFAGSEIPYQGAISFLQAYDALFMVHFPKHCELI